MALDFDIDHFILRAGLGLEAEDRLLLGSHLIRGEHGGLVRLFNERYLQFIVWRSLTPKWDVKVEHDFHDLVVFDHEKNYAAVFEMKPWTSDNGEKELPKIKDDIDKLQKRSSPLKGMMIFSANPRRQFQENATWIEERVSQLNPYNRKSFIFNTINAMGEEIEFWVGLWIL